MLEQIDKHEIPEAEKFFFFGNPIRVVGCGGAGVNIVNYLYEKGVFGADLISIDTDERHLSVVRSGKKITIGRSLTRGTGSGGDPEKGKKAAEMFNHEVYSTFQHTKLIFLIAGLGGGTGTGATPVLARLGRDYRATVVAIVTLPSKDDTKKREVAEKDIAELLKAADTVVAIYYDMLPGYECHLLPGDNLSCMDELIVEKIKVICEAMTRRPFIHVDILDLKNLMTDGGLGVMVARELRCDNYIMEVLNRTLNKPLLDVDYTSADRALIHITCGRDMPIPEALSIVENMYKEMNPNIKILWGVKIEKDDFLGKLKLLVILNGIDGTKYFK